MRKGFLTLLVFGFLFLGLVGFVTADTCSPSGGYTSCYEWSDHYSYGDARAESYVQIQGTEVQGNYRNGYWIGPTYIGYKITADKAYLYLNQKSWDALFSRANCDANDGKSCKNANQELSSQGKYYLTKNRGDNFIGCPAFLGTDYDYDEEDVPGSMPGEVFQDWAWTYTYGGWGWVGTDCLNIKQVECIEDSDCGYGSYCDKNGGWQDWNCKVRVCEDGEERCTGANFQICAGNSWVDKGALINKCGVECTSDLDCPADEITDTYCSGNTILKTTTDNKCSDNQCLSSTTDEIIESCSYDCEDVAGDGAICIDQICDAGDIMCSPEGNSLTCYGNQWFLNEECPYGCESGKCNPFTTSKTFYSLLFGIGGVLTLLLIILIILVIRKKK